MGTQAPSACGTLHASHWPSHGASQQTPSTQKSLAQVMLEVHAVPFEALAVQLPASHHPMGVQSASDAQEVLHAPFSHRYRPQSDWLCWQTPDVPHV
jgi:hypothetical protein